MQVLFRMVDCEDGSVAIDGVNTKAIGLAALRSRLTIIPQVRGVDREGRRETLSGSYRRISCECSCAWGRSRRRLALILRFAIVRCTSTTTIDRARVAKDFVPLSAATLASFVYFLPAGGLLSLPC